MIAQRAESSGSASSTPERLPALMNIVDVIEDHQNQFVFSSTMMQLVSNLLLRSFDSGQFTVIEQLLCSNQHQQDQCDDDDDSCSYHILSLLMNELRTTRQCPAAVALLRAIAQLIRMSHDHLNGRGWLHKQMEALRFDELMLSLRARFRPLHSFIGTGVSSSSSSVPASSSAACDLLLEETIDECLMLMTKEVTQQRHGVETAVTNRTDADSGTFSGDEEETKQQQQMMLIGQQMGEKDEHKNAHQLQQQQQLLEEILSIVHTLPAQELPLLLKLLHIKRPLSELISLISDLDDNCHQSTSCCQFSIGTEQLKQSLLPPPSPPPTPQTLLSTAGTLRSSSASSSFSPAPPPPPPPGPLVVRPPPPPPPPPLLLASPGGATTSREPTKMLSSSRSQQQLLTPEIPSALRPKALPDQCRRLRHLQWTKLPTNAVAAATSTITSSTPAATTAVANPCPVNVWQTMEEVDKEMRDRLDFAVLDAFFGFPSNTPQTITSSENIPCRSTAPSTSRRRSSMILNGGGGDHVTLLDAKRSLSVNVFLKMCRDSGQLLIDLAEGKADKIGADRLRTISHLLPSSEEQKLLRDFSGDKHMLGAAEQFLLALIERIPAHRLRVEAMLFRLDLQAMLETNRPIDSGLGLKVWLKGCQELLGSSALRKVLYALLHLGNYLNHGAGAGNAVGFRLSSLWKVEDVKTIGGTTRGRTLLHFVAQQVDNCAQELAAELENVREAAKSSLEAICDDVRSLSERMHCLEEGFAQTKYSSSATEDDTFLDEFLHFLEKSRHIISFAERQLIELGTLRRSVALFLCEQERSFSLEECFKVIAWFVTRFEKAVEDNRRFMAMDQLHQQQQLETDHQLRKASPDQLNDGIALKSSVIKKWDRQIALVDERERQKTPPCSSSPSKVRRRRTAHSVVPLQDTRSFLNGLEESNERTAELDTNCLTEQSLEAVVDQALMRREIVSAREAKHMKTVEEKQREEEQKTTTGMEQQTVYSAEKKIGQNGHGLAIQQPHQTLASNEVNPLQMEAVLSSALATLSNKAKRHLTDRRSTTNHLQQGREAKNNPTMKEKGGTQRFSQSVPGQVGPQQCIGIGSKNNINSQTNTKPTASRFPVVVVARKIAKPALVPAPKRCADSSTSKCPPAVCRIRMVAKPSNNNVKTMEDQQLSQRKALSDCPLKPSEVKASQPKMPGGVVTLSLNTASAAASNTGKNMPMMVGPSGLAATAAKTKPSPLANKRSATGGTGTSPSQQSTAGTMAKIFVPTVIKSQQQQKEKIVPETTQQQRHGERAATAAKNTTVTRRLSTSSRPTLVHSAGRNGGKMTEKPKWI